MTDEQQQNFPTRQQLDTVIELLTQILAQNAATVEKNVQSLKQSEGWLNAAIAANPVPKGVSDMAAKKAPLDDLTAQVTATVGVEQSAITLIQGTAAYIQANINNPTALEAFVAQLNASQTALAAAVAANPTPS